MPVNINELKAYNCPEGLIEILRTTGLKELYPTQELALKAGLLSSEDSFVVSAPTASGKTLIAEIIILKRFLETHKKTIYLVPLRALAREKHDDLSRKYSSTGMRVFMSTGDYDSDEPYLHTADIIIATNEKIDSLIRHHAKWLKHVGLVIADEIHLIGDSHRGPTLEVVLTRLKEMNHAIRFIALSATIHNSGEIARWLNARLIESNWRPVPLREGVYFNSAISFVDGTKKMTSLQTSSDVIDLALSTLKEGGQVLIFVNTRRSTEAVSSKALRYVSAILNEKERGELQRLSDEVIKAVSEPTHICKRLAEHVKAAVAFHHAGVNSSQRKLIEDGFRANKLKLIASTTTLSMGLNLPSRRVIIRDWLRYESGMGIEPIPVIEIKQMSGRAGRPGFDEYGEAVVIAKNKRDELYLFEKYIKGVPEDVISQLANLSALRTHILSGIAGAFTINRQEILNFLKMTLSSVQMGVRRLTSLTDDVLEFLLSEDMVVSKGGELIATRFGRRISELYIDPLTGVLIRDALHLPKEKGVFPLLHMIAHTPDMMRLSLKKKDYEEMQDVFYGHKDELLLREDEKYPSDELLSELKTASTLMQWILEMPEDKITGHFGIGPGDLRTLIELSEWLLYSSAEIANVFGLKEEIRNSASLRVRVSYGVKEELLELVSLKGIGRIRARALYGAGFCSRKDIKTAGIDELSRVPTIGRVVAESIKKQAER